MEDSVTESEIKREIERKQGDREEEEEEEQQVLPRERDEEMIEGGFINQFISNLVSPSSPKSREIYEGAGKMEEETRSGEGIINKISNFFHQENEDEEKEIDEVEEVQVKVEEEGEEKKKKKKMGVEELDNGGGGMINNLISNFFHQNESEEKEIEKGKRSEEVGEELKMEEEDEKDSRNRDLELDNGGGGMINNLISNFFHQNEGEGEGEGGGGEEEKGTNTDQELINGKGVVGKEQESKMKVEGENGGIINNLVSNLTASLPENIVPASDEASILIHSIIHD